MTCEACGVAYPIRDGIHDFRCQRHDYYFNPVPRDKMNDLVRRAPDVEWDETVRGFLRHVRNVPDWVDNVAVNGRYAWKLFLELAPGSRFLDFGCGLGNLTRNIAPHVSEVVALDLTWERLLFAQQRFAKFNGGQRIALVAGGDSAHLPFPDQHFDAVALSGVLEWIAADPSLHASRTSRLRSALAMLMTFFGESNPRRTQLRFMRELRRILKPDGQLFVAIENRWGYEYFLGRPDHHSSLKYASLMPRFLANAYSIASRGKPYRTYTYGLPALRKLFEAAGFPEQECLGLTPGYSGVEEIIPVHSNQAFWKPAGAADWKAWIKRSRHFVPAFGVVGHGSRARQPLLGRVLDDIKVTVPKLGDIELHTCLVSGKEKAVFQGTAAGKAVILKIPVEPRAEAGELNAVRVVASLAADSRLTALLPAPLTDGVHQGVVYFVEQAVAGRPLGVAWTSWTRASAARMIGDVLLRLHPSVAGPVPVDAASQTYSALVKTPVARLRSAGLASAECERLEHVVGTSLMARSWPLGIAHGDFSRHNIFVSGSECSGIIDWEYATTSGIAALDALAYMESVQRLEDQRAGRRRSMGENMIRLARWEWTSGEELEMLKGLYRHFQVDTDLHALLCQLCWLQHIGHQLETTRRFDSQFMTGSVRPILTEWLSRS